MDIILRCNLTHHIRGNLRIDPLTAGRVVALRAVLAPSRTGIGYDEILAGLGKMYVADERFKKNIDKYGEGTAEFAAEAIAVYCRKA